MTEPLVEQSTANSHTDTTSSKSILRYLTLGISSLLFLGMLVVVWLIQSPGSFTDARTFTIAEGSSVQTIAHQAEAEGVVRSSLALYATLVLQYDPQSIYAGTYALQGPMNVFAVAAQLASRETELDLLRVTLPEGLRTTYMADIVSETTTIDRNAYLQAAEGSEGYLFPETYLIPPTMTADELVALQRDMFNEVYADLKGTATTTLSQTEVVTLASIVEREANDDVSMRMVAGILLNRLAIDMPLQADATIEYTLDVPLNELRAGELAIALREEDSPYNSYLNRGLPPTPISNPGEQALQAVLTPTPSDYFYYITGNDGEFYYAETLAEHNRNIEQYLR